MLRNIKYTKTEWNGFFSLFFYDPKEKVKYLKFIYNNGKLLGILVMHEIIKITIKQTIIYF